MIFFNVDDPKHLQEVKTALANGAAGGLATLQAAVEELHRPGLDDMVKNAASIFGDKLYEFLTLAEKRLARLVTALHNAHLDWAGVVKNVVVPKPLPIVPKA